MNKLTFNALRTANNARQKEWPGNDKIDIAFRTIEVAGECGELAEAIKKYLRADRGIKGSTAGLENIADELADVIISIDLLAADLHIDLGQAVSSKFNATSNKYNLKTYFRNDDDFKDTKPGSEISKLDRVNNLRNAAIRECVSWLSMNIFNYKLEYLAGEMARELLDDAAKLNSPLRST